MIQWEETSENKQNFAHISDLFSVSPLYILAKGPRQRSDLASMNLSHISLPNVARSSKFLEGR